jgi:hypothetical protein
MNKQLVKALGLSILLDVLFALCISHYSLLTNYDGTLIGVLFGIVSAFISGAIFLS